MQGTIDDIGIANFSAVRQIFQCNLRAAPSRGPRTQEWMNRRRRRAATRARATRTPETTEREGHSGEKEATEKRMEDREEEIDTG